MSHCCLFSSQFTFKYRAIAILVIACALLFSLSSPALAALVCGNPGSEPSGNPSGVINDYWPGSGSPAAGSSTINLSARRSGSAGNSIQAGDMVLIIQMQDADIDSDNTNNYGGADGTGSGATAVNSTGLYEYVRASNAVGAGGGPLTFTPALANSYRSRNATGSNGQSRWQAIRVPQYSSATSSNVTAPAWNGETGGVVALDVQSTLILGGGTAIDVAGLGFRGGAGRQLGGAAGADTDFRTLATANTNAGKGEGVAGTPRYINDAGYNGAPNLMNTGTEGYPNGSYARGAPGNAGGGGTDGNPPANNQNSGGGGGSNYGFGGQGGNAWNSGDPSGGRGGARFSSVLAPNRVFLGGGGGAGTTNDGTSDTNTYTSPPGVACSAGNGLCSSGAAGGGIVLIRAGSISGSGSINASGADAYNVGNDGGGGGGAGGTVVLQAYHDGNAYVDVSGGNGGNTWRDRNTDIDRHGPGGGGGGGYIAYSPSTGFNVSADYASGLSGLSSNNDPFGSTSGNGGFSTYDLVEIPGVQPGFLCQPAIKAVSLAVDNGTAGVIDPGDTVEYTIVYHNVSSAAISGFNITDTLPGQIDFVAGSLTVTPSGGASGSANSAYDGTISTSLLAANVTLPVNGIITATLRGTTKSNASACAQVSNQADSIQSSGEDLGLTDNADNNQNEIGLPSGTYIDQTPFGTSGTTDATGFTLSCSDLSTSTKDWIDINGGDQVPGDVLRYTITLVNSGGGSASGVTVTDDMDSNLVWGGVQSCPTGASCTYSAGQLTVSNVTVPANGSVDIVYDVTINSSASAGTTIDNMATVINPDGPEATPEAPQVIVNDSSLSATGKKPLYLYSGGNPVLSRIPTSSTNYVTIGSHRSVTWTQDIPMQESLTLDPTETAVPVSLWMWVYNTSSVSLTLDCGSIHLTNSSSVPATGGNWGQRSFSLPYTSTQTCAAGNSWTLTINNTSNNTVYVQATNGGSPSEVTLPSATVINVNTVDIFSDSYINGGGTSLTTASAGQTVYIRSTVSDPFGSFDISSATLTLTDPSSTVRVNGSAMTEVHDDNNALKIFEYEYTIPDSGSDGRWAVEVEADEGTEGTVSDIGNSTFTVSPMANLVDSTKDWQDLNGGDQDPGDTLRYSITLVESGGVEASGVSVTDVLDPNLSWVGMNSCPTGASCAFAAGQLTVTDLTVPASGSVDIVFDVTITAGTSAGTVIDNSAAIQNPDGIGGTADAPPVTVSASGIPGTGNKPLYLYDNSSAPAYKLSRAPMTGNSNPIILQSRSNSNQEQDWTLSPALQSEVTLNPTISDVVPVTLYLSNDSTSSTWRTREVYVALQCSSGGTILEDSQSVQLNDTVIPVDFSLPLNTNLTCPGGGNWVLTVENIHGSNNRNFRVYPTYNGNSSQVILPSENVINVDRIEYYSAASPGGSLITSATPGAPLSIRATVSDPFGYADITAARVTLTGPDGSILGPLAMTALSGASGALKTFEFFVDPVPAGTLTGNWTVRVEADEGTEGEVSDFAQAALPVAGPDITLVKMVQAYSDPVNGTSNPYSIPGSVMRYTIMATNTGAGATDADSVTITDQIPAQTDLVVSGSPISFINGATASGLSFNAASDVGYFDAGDNPVSPSPDGNDVDPAVRKIVVNPQGTFVGSSGAPHPSFSIIFHVRVR